MLRQADFLHPKVFIKEERKGHEIGDRSSDGAIYTDERVLLSKQLEDRNALLYHGRFEILNTSPDFARKAGESYTLKSYRLRSEIFGTPLQDFLFSEEQLVEHVPMNRYQIHITAVPRKVVIHEQKKQGVSNVPFFPGHYHMITSSTDPRESRPHAFKWGGDIMTLYVCGLPADSQLRDIRGSAVMIDNVVYPLYSNTTQSPRKVLAGPYILEYLGSDGGADGVGGCNKCFGNTSFSRVLDSEYIVASNDDYRAFPFNVDSELQESIIKLISPKFREAPNIPISDSYMLKCLAYKFHPRVFNDPGWQTLSIDDYDWALVRWNFGLFAGHVNQVLVERMTGYKRPVILTGEFAPCTIFDGKPLIEFWKEPWEQRIEKYGRRRSRGMNEPAAGEFDLVYTTSPLNSVFFVIDRVLERIWDSVPVSEEYLADLRSKFPESSSLQMLLPKYLKIRYVHQLLDKLRNVNAMRYLLNNNLLRGVYPQGMIPDEVVAAYGKLGDISSPWVGIFTAKEEEILLNFFSELNYEDYRYAIDKTNRFAWSILGVEGVR